MKRYEDRKEHGELMKREEAGQGVENGGKSTLGTYLQEEQLNLRTDPVVQTRGFRSIEVTDFWGVSGAYYRFYPKIKHSKNKEIDE